VATFAVAGLAESVKEILGGMVFGGISPMVLVNPLHWLGLFNEFSG